MNRAFVLILTSFALLLMDSIVRASEPIVQQANAWRPGQPVPVELLAYRKADTGQTYMPSAQDTLTVIGSITNTPLLLEMLFNPKIDDRVFAQVVSQALRLSGPKMFLNDAYRRYQRQAEALLFPMHKRLFYELNQRHAMVDAIFINEVDMPAQEGFATLRQMIADMQAGKSWDNVYSTYSSNLKSEVDFGGAKVVLSKVSRFGPVILCEQKQGDQTFVSDPLPKEHRTVLLQRAEGDLVTIHDPERRRVVLYRVRELYVPKPD
jgi:hypothetical protein